MNDYRKLMEEIAVPAELEERVLRAAQRQPKRLAKRSWKPMVRGAVCAACALALVLGTVQLRPAEKHGEQPETPPGITLDYAFGLTAYAADTGETVQPNANGGLALVGSKKAETLHTVLHQDAAEQGIFTEYRFQICGQEIWKVKLSINQGGLYRREQSGEPEPVGSSVEELYDPSVSYGLWVPPEAFQAGGGAGIFHGAELCVTAVFADGAERTERYLLTPEKLRVFHDEDGVLALEPGLTGDEQADIHGLYAARLSSRWLQWPVQESRTVWKGNPYGVINGKTHNGIDIPAQQGAVILAAADGTVAETGFDAARGNYLVLEHGDGLTTVYAHCRNVDVNEGDSVKAGEMVAAVGSTGMSTGPHLHFEVRQDGAAQNPVAYFDSAVRNTLNAA